MPGLTVPRVMRFKGKCTSINAILEHTVNLSCVGKLFSNERASLQTWLTAETLGTGSADLCIYCACVVNPRWQGPLWQTDYGTLNVSDKMEGPGMRGVNNLIAAQGQRMDAELMQPVICGPQAFPWTKAKIIYIFTQNPAEVHSILRC